MKYLSTIAAACMLAVMSKVALALPILTPSGLNPGDTYQLVFVTSTTTNAEADYIGYYNSFVQAAADAAFVGTILDGVGWSAIGSTPTVNARDNALVAGLVYNLGNVLVASDYNAMWDGALDAPIDVDEFGGPGGSFVWTGTGSSGVRNGSYPLGSLSATSSFGIAGGYDGAWLDVRLPDPSFGEKPLYALSAVITVPAGQTPTPATLALFGLGLVGMGISRRKRNRIS